MNSDKNAYLGKDKGIMRKRALLLRKGCSFEITRLDLVRFTVRRGKKAGMSRRLCVNVSYRPVERCITHEWISSPPDSAILPEPLSDTTRSSVNLWRKLEANWAYRPEPDKGDIRP
ncbi:hypothetical protein XENOCAPTIV_007080 [Xenoophorus captivus]|uniref:Uncharacterized protein n=1 Tax=Xenoophorus captivus TaxID=1517983 RepID=A0ABV0QGX6_9TELE